MTIEELYRCIAIYFVGIVVLNIINAHFISRLFKDVHEHLDKIEHDVEMLYLFNPNNSIKTVTNAKEAENYPISEDMLKGIEEINKLIFENGQAESEDKE